MPEQPALATPVLHVFVPGHAAPQGSKKHLGKGVLVESSKQVRPWRESVRWHLLDTWHTEQLDGPVAVDLMFVLKRPASTPKRRTPAAVKKPDLDKLARAVLDAIGSAGVWRDDAQVVALVSGKRLAQLGEAPGCQITIYPVEANT